MCGISGFVDFTGRSTDSDVVRMTDVLFRRGPDDSGVLFEPVQSCSVGLGHRRLSVLDLSPEGHQPMSFEHLTLVYNGEIYNFREIREELIELGYSFHSASDTEVLLKAYHCWGEAMLPRLNGMFALVFYDRQRNQLLLIRDRAGVKPLFWFYKDGLFLFSSELKSFHQHPRFEKKLDFGGLSLFLQYGYIPQPSTIFEDTFKLKAGHSLTLDLETQETREECYWDVSRFYQQPKLDLSESEALQQAERLLQSSCEYRMVSDVPVGVFLSGGYDSSAVAALLQASRSEKIKTFSIGFHEEAYNEAHHARRVADFLGTDHIEYYCTQSDALEIIPKIAEVWDEPFGDASAIPTLLVSKLAREQVTVALSADGGDEAFGGYNKYLGIGRKIKANAMVPEFARSAVKQFLHSTASQQLAGKIGIRNAEERMARFSLMLGASEGELLSITASKFTPPEMEALLNGKAQKVPTAFEEVVGGHWLDNVLAIDYKTFQSDCILPKVDRATMYHSLEGREPLLDHRLIEFLARLSPDLKIKNGVKKYLLKTIVHEHIPESIMDRPKKGFSIPIFEWFSDELKVYLLHYLSRERLAKAGIFNPEYVVNLRDRYLDGAAVNVTKLWHLLVFEMWRDTWQPSI
ncbi:asparagine synthase (glutamine-hydrolyzing) [Marinobacter nauticus]|uniref:asparagine synthase (glutamine-hydrolyzing) n=1 Tax=Marinobacter nauticus TaxID=2743 RepID=UPI001CFD98ED|nr:asparagine synthase (glutamine-hydrolyzing) [Marinobacter nauticus]